MTDIDKEITLETPIYKCVLKKSCSVTKNLYKVISMIFKDVCISFLPIIGTAIIVLYLLLTSKILLYVIELGLAFGAFLLKLPEWLVVFMGATFSLTVVIVIYSYLWCLERRALLKLYFEHAKKWDIPITNFQNSTSYQIVSVTIPVDKYYVGIIDSLFEGTGGRNYTAKPRIYGDVVLVPFRKIENTVRVLDYLYNSENIPSKIVILDRDEYTALPNACHMKKSEEPKEE